MQIEATSVMRRSGWLRALTTLVVAASSLTAGQAGAFGLDDVARDAEALARQPYREPAPLPAELAQLSYDDYRKVRYRPDQGLWRPEALPFELQFFHVGRGFTRPLKLMEIVDGQARPLEIPRAAFSDEGVLPPSEVVSGIAGLRVHHALNTPKVMDELIVFLGASYFRALGAGQRYGLSARGLAVDTAGGNGEEFPAFTAFWLERPVPGAQTLRLYALLDGPRVAGAYQFDVKPGQTTVVDVQARLWLRAPVATLGIAPLSSMFLHGENQPVADDYRPEVHDSDGLQIATGDGEWIWRPLTNPRRGAFVTSFALKSPRGFGLQQRDRSFTSYEDLEAAYERRPSVWIEPLGDWGAGRVELLQFHTPDETHDNIAAYWVPQTLPPPGQPLAIGWRMHWAADAATQPPGARVVQTRFGHGYREAPIPPQRLQFHLDFDGPALAGLPADAAVEAVVSGNDNARALRAIVYPNPARGGWRVSIDVERADAGRALELRAFLRLGDRTLSETWSYALAPQ
ncbi:glucan biosynthesis protein G [Rubrivivax sp. JA1055]|nr:MULTISPECIES: glucan biosynthesis protein G [unclassified Rubrivivax]MCC9597491.1 glucan biosynthesis protein G [Rubrivivax sp. JA1055]MCC9646251.1 glucan biosynthesis protein G [Rubrivivax sp. JA1029]